MSTYYYGPALDSELDYRRSALLRDAATHRLARQARRATPAAVRTAMLTAARPALALISATARSAPVPADASAGPAGPVERPVARAA